MSKIPDNFEKIITDITGDLTITFPEYAYLWEKWTLDKLNELNEKDRIAEIQYIYQYCINYYPNKFFDILYLNEDIFKISVQDNDKSPNSSLEESRSMFLPGVDFKILYNCNGVSEKNRKIMWNYLQVILVTIIGSIDTKDSFGETTKTLFEGINEEDLYEKLKDTLCGLFQNMGETNNEENEGDNGVFETGKDENGKDENGKDVNGKDENGKDENGEDENGEDDHDTNKDGDIPSFFKNIKNLPNIKDIYGHLKELFDGKIGSLAKEMAEEISGDMNNIFGISNENGENSAQPNTTKEMIEQLIKNPEKLTSLIKKVSEKLNTKISSGEISKDEILKEATDILGKMKDMGDMKQFENLFKNFSKMSGMGTNGKLNMNSLQQMSKHSSMREKLKKRMMQKKTQQLNDFVKNNASNMSLPNTDEFISTQSEPISPPQSEPISPPQSEPISPPQPPPPPTQKNKKPKRKNK